MAAESASWSDLLGMGLVAGVALLAGLGLGWLVDSITGYAPVFLLLGLMLGIVATVWYVITQFRKYLKSA